MGLGEQYIRSAVDHLRRAMQARSAELSDMQHDIRNMEDEINRRKSESKDNSSNKLREIVTLRAALKTAQSELENNIRQHESSENAQGTIDQLGREFSAFESATTQKIIQHENDMSKFEEDNNRIIRELQNRIDEKRRPLRMIDDQVRDLERKAVEVEQTEQQIPSNLVTN